MKFISGSYDHNTGISTVVIQHLGVKFTGRAYLHPDDKENVSSYAGCEYAETRAKIKALKYERMIAKNKADMAIDLLKSCQCYKNFNTEDATAKVLYRQVNRRIKKVNELTDRINELMKSIDKRIFARDITIKSIKRKKELQSKLDNK